MKIQKAVIAWCLFWPLASLVTYLYFPDYMGYVGLIGLLGLCVVIVLIVRMVKW